MFRQTDKMIYFGGCQWTPWQKTSKNHKKRQYKSTLYRLWNGWHTTTTKSPIWPWFSPFRSFKPLCWHPVVIFSDNHWGGSNHRNKTHSQLRFHEANSQKVSQDPYKILKLRSTSCPTQHKKTWKTHGFQPWFRPPVAPSDVVPGYQGTCAAATRSIS